MSRSEDSRPALRAPDAPGWRIEVVEESASTNAELAGRLPDGAGHATVLAAEHQTAGRGRLGRDWTAPPRSALLVSVLLEPTAAPERWSWLPLLTGVAVARAVASATTLQPRLKWPNDVLLGEHKVGGILLERIDHGGRAAAVVGIGINVHQRRDELPLATATSLALAGAEVDRGRLLGAVLGELRAAYDAWAAGQDPRAAYLALCTTPGRAVRVVVPGGEVHGEAVDVDASGRLVVRTATGVERLGAGDVVHVRPLDQATE